MSSIYLLFYLVLSHRLRMFENRVMGRIFGHKREEVLGDQRRLHNEDLHNLYTSPNIVTVIESRRMRLADHVACMGEVGIPLWKA